jgi:hypothetical protein
MTTSVASPDPGDLETFYTALACGLHVTEAGWLAGMSKDQSHSRAKSKQTRLLVEYAWKQPGLGLLEQLYRSHIAERDRARQAAREERPRQWLEQHGLLQVVAPSP